MPRRSESESSSSSSEDSRSASRSRSRSEKKRHSKRDKDHRKSRKNYKHRDDKKKKRRRSSSASSESISRSRSKSRDKTKSRAHDRRKPKARSRSRSEEKRVEKKVVKEPSPPASKQSHMTEEEIEREKERKRQIRLAKVKALKYERDDVAESPLGRIQTAIQEEVKEAPQETTAQKIGIVDSLEADEEDRASSKPEKSTAQIEALEEEEDPLDAFMRENDQQAAKQVIESLNKENPPEFRAPESHQPAKVITLEELQQIHKLPQKKVFLEDDIFPEVHGGRTYEEEKPQEEEEEDDEEYRKAFMEALKKAAPKKEEPSMEIERNGAAEKDKKKKVEKEILDDGLEDVYIPDEEELNEGEFITKKKKEAERKELRPIDHLAVEYRPFRKNFYIETKEIASMTPEEVEKYRKELGEIQVRGKDCPKPIKNWYQCGLSDSILNVLVEKRKFTSPFPIQCQALPAVMSGRDVIGIAETGSGKTLAYLLPLIRHIKDQPPLEEGDGPIGLIMVPTRELATQIHHECKIFCKAVGLNAALIYGGAGMANQIADLKRGAEIVVCTPGRMIDVLSASNGKITNLRRVTFVVLDEADRMFDLGFEPQIAKIMSNIRPDRQTVMFSATFPRNVENLAKKILQKPVEIIVGSRGKICANIEQIIEVIDEDSKFLRLLEILGEWSERGSILIFVDKQTEADNLFKELLKFGYFPLVLHGGQDPTDREFTILDFKKGVRTLMVATSVCARGLDIHSIVLVINYKCPNHKEDYIHRIGRTGRAGNKGTAITFITPEEEQYSLDIIAALKMSHLEPPPDLAQLAEDFREKVEKGEAKYYTNKNLKGTGYKFDANEMGKAKDVKRAMKRQFGLELDLSDVELSDDEIISKKEEKGKEKEFDEKEILKMIKDPTTKAAIMQAATKAAKDAIQAGATSEEVLAAAHNAIKGVLVQYRGSGVDQLVRIRDQLETREEESGDFVSADLEINDYPQSARHKVTQKDFITMIHDLTNCTISVRGSYYEPTKKVPPGAKKMTLHIVGESKYDVGNAYREIRRILDETALQASNTVSGQMGKYTI